MDPVILFGAAMAAVALFKKKPATTTITINPGNNSGSGSGSDPYDPNAPDPDAYWYSNSNTGGDPNQILYGGEINVTGTQKSYIQKGVAYPMNRVNFSVSGQFTTEASTAVPTSDFIQKTSNGVVYYGAKGNRNMNTPGIEIFIGHYDLQGVFVKDVTKTVDSF